MTVFADLTDEQIGSIFEWVDSQDPNASAGGNTQRRFGKRCFGRRRRRFALDLDYFGSHVCHYHNGC